MTMTSKKPGKRPKKALPTDLTIYRDLWYRGQGSEYSALILGPNRAYGQGKFQGQLCCLGFDGMNCGVPPERLLDHEMPHGVAFWARRNLPEYWKTRSDPQGAGYYMSNISDVNDNQNLTDRQRETKLRKMFKDYLGVTVHFTSKPSPPEMRQAIQNSIDERLGDKR